MKKAFFALLALSFLGSALGASAASWPATDATGTDIGTAWRTADSTIEPSGLSWDAYWNAFVAVSDEGQIALIQEDGTLLNSWDLGSSYDLEDVTVVDSTTALVYLMDENTSYIEEFDTNTGTLTGKFWDCSAYIVEDGYGWGAEGLTWVPDGYSALAAGTSGGHFYVGWQEDGNVYVFDADLATSGTATYIETINMDINTDVSGLFWNTDTQLLYALYDNADILEELTADGVLVASYALPTGHDQEGVTLVPQSSSVATISIAEDTSEGTAQIMSYTGYPIVIVDPDADSDGVHASADCNDADSSVSVNATYYVDADSDGLGDSTMSTTACLSTAPAGYVDNSTDANDQDFDNDGVSTSADCDDTDSALSTESTYYADTDSDGLGSDVTTTVCSLSIPVGYVDNSEDTNDAIPNNGVEIDADGVDNDSDSIIDERNTVSANGLHPYYSTLSVADTTLFGTEIEHVVGGHYGRVIVRYGDNSVYVYRVLTAREYRKTRTHVISTSGYVLVRNKHHATIVNMLTGAVVARRATPRTHARLVAWVQTVTGLTF